MPLNCVENAILCSMNCRFCPLTCITVTKENYSYSSLLFMLFMLLLQLLKMLMAVVLTIVAVMAVVVVSVAIAVTVADGIDGSGDVHV